MIKQLSAAVPSNDRIQRVVCATLLIGLNGFGLAESPDWPKWGALALQIELLATGLAGWCPLYWCMRRVRR